MHSDGLPNSGEPMLRHSRIVPSPAEGCLGGRPHFARVCMARNSKHMNTEDEARTLWCPMVRHEGEGGTFNRGWAAHNPLNLSADIKQAAFACNCIATRCSAWRWGQPVSQPTLPCPDALATREPERPADMPASWSFIPCFFGVTRAHWAAPESAIPRRGHCGLFGNPLIR